MQTIVFSAYVDVDVSALLRRECYNTRGGMMLRGSYSGTIARVVPTVRQVFVRISAPSLAAADDARFAHFSQRVLPELVAGVSMESGSGSGPAARTMIVVPSYYDYVRLRNLLDASELEFVTLSEYSEDGDVSRARARFYAGDSPILLMTERFHFWRRYRIRGARHIIFYAPLANPHFYSELLNMLGEAASASYDVSTLLLFGRHDAPPLERIVGGERAARLLEDGPKNTFVFL